MTEHLAHPHVADHRLLEEKPGERPAAHDRKERKLGCAETLERRRQRILRAYRREILDAGHHLVDRRDRPALLLDLAEVADRDEADHPIAGDDRYGAEVERQDEVADERADHRARLHRRSEERRVGKECRSRWGTEEQKTRREETRE